MGFVMLGESERGVLVHVPLLEPDLLYFGIDLFLMIKIVSKRAVYLGRGELREVLQDVFSRQPSTVANRHRTDGKTSPFENWPPAAYAPLSFNVGMHRSCFSYWHRNLSLFHVFPSFSPYPPVLSPIHSPVRR